MKNLPIGIQTFEKLINSNNLYIDKTELIHDLITTGSTYFLSRPRRFGKSLLISTLEALFKGKKELFKDLWIESSDWQWTEHPVIRIDFSTLLYESSDDLIYGLKQHLLKIAASYQVVLRESKSLKLMFDELIAKLSSINSVVVLIDEYDKPIIQHLGKNDAIAIANREVLKDFYEVIKGNDEYIKFVLLTGITKFSKMSVFSGLNNLDDISMSKRYACLLGCTEQEIDDNFAQHVQALADDQELTLNETRDKMRQWYNGFRFSDNENKVYNPFSLLLLFKNLRFDSYWFSTATPTFLINLIREKNYDIRKIETKCVDRRSFDSYDIENLRVLPLLLQTGYLTISHYDKKDDVYDLSYPNFEVREAFSQDLMTLLTGIPQEETSSHLLRSVKCLKAGDIDGFVTSLKVFFANVPYAIQLPKEQYWQTVFFIVFEMLGFRINAEVMTNDGRIDIVIEIANTVTIFEFKLDGSAKKAMQQIHDKKYWQKYQLQNKVIVLVGVNFDRETRNIGDYLIETL